MTRRELLLLDNPIQNYAWGSRTSLAQLLGRPPAAQPEAELWIGAHPKAPSRLSDGRSLLDVIRADPAGMLGDHVEARFGARLPFLLKVLAVDSPLSLQAHPNLEQAARGFMRERAAGVPIDAPERTYKDDNHKPELLCALTPFEALCGFRRPDEAAELFEWLGVSSLALSRELRAGDADALKRAFSLLMTLTADARARVVAEVLGRCEQASSAGGRFGGSISWALKLAALYPGDIGVVASLLLNHLRLAPLEAVYLEAGRLHAYLRGTGVEIMANSDNVLRGGLTPKHVDVAELSSVLVFDSPAVEACPTRGLPCGEVVYETPAPEFQLSRLELGPETRFRNLASCNPPSRNPASRKPASSDPPSVAPRGPEILLCVEGQAWLELLGPVPAAPRPLRRGHACFVSASSAGYELRGNGLVFRATVGSSASSA